MSNLEKIVRKQAAKEIKRCKEKAYGTPYAGNGLEGDFGNWSDWEEVLVQFALSIRSSNVRKKPVASRTSGSASGKRK